MTINVTPRIQLVSVDEIRDRLAEAEADLVKKGDLVRLLGDIARCMPENIAKEEFRRAINASTENFGIACALFADINQELNAAVDAMD